MEEGRLKLASWLLEHGVSTQSLADRVGVTRQAVENWLSGKYYPTHGHPQLLELATSFADKDAWEFVEPVRAEDWSKADPAPWRRMRLLHKLIEKRGRLTDRREVLARTRELRSEADLALTHTSPGTPEHAVFEEKLSYIDEIGTPLVREQIRKEFVQLLGITATLISDAERDVARLLPAGVTLGDEPTTIDPPKYRAAVKSLGALERSLSDLLDSGSDPEPTT